MVARRNWFTYVALFFSLFFFLLINNVAGTSFAGSNIDGKSKGWDMWEISFSFFGVYNDLFLKKEISIGCSPSFEPPP